MWVAAAAAMPPVIRMLVCWLRGAPCCLVLAGCSVTLRPPLAPDAAACHGDHSEDSGSDAGRDSSLQRCEAAAAVNARWVPAVPCTLLWFSRLADGGHWQSLQLRMPASLQADSVEHLLREERWKLAREEAARRPSGGWNDSVQLREAAEIEFLATLPLSVPSKARRLRQPLWRAACGEAVAELPMLACMLPACTSLLLSLAALCQRVQSNSLLALALLLQEAARLLGISRARLSERARWVMAASLGPVQLGRHRRCSRRRRVHR